MVLGSGTSGRWAPGALGQSNRAVGTSARKDRCEASLDGAVGSFRKELWSPGALGQYGRAVGTSARKDRCEASLDGAVGSSGMSCGHRARLVRTTGLLALARGSIVGEASWAMGVG